MKKPASYMKISDLVKKTGVSRYSIHHYLRLGLLPKPYRKNKTMAYYGEEHLDCLNMIKDLRDQGYSLYVIEQMLARYKDDTQLDQAIESLPVPKQVQKNKEAKRQKLIEAASRVFSEKGYYRTTISDITDEMGIGKSTFYLYFQNKKELFFCCIDDILDHLWRDDFGPISEEKNIGRRIGIRGRAFVRVYPQIRDLLQMMRGAAIVKEEGMETKYNETYKKLVKPLIQDLKKGMKQSRIVQTDPEMLAFIIMGMIESVAYRITLDDKYTIENAWDVLKELATFYRPESQPAMESKSPDRETSSNLVGQTALNS